MAFKVTLIEGKDDIAFEFHDMVSASKFIDTALDKHKGKETDCGKTELVVEVEAIKDDF